MNLFRTGELHYAFLLPLRGISEQEISAKWMLLLHALHGKCIHLVVYRPVFINVKTMMKFHFTLSLDKYKDTLR